MWNFCFVFLFGWLEIPWGFCMECFLFVFIFGCSERWRGFCVEFVCLYWFLDDTICFTEPCGKSHLPCWTVTSSIFQNSVTRDYYFFLFRKITVVFFYLFLKFPSAILNCRACGYFWKFRHGAILADILVFLWIAVFFDVRKMTQWDIYMDFINFVL